ncbi:chitinase [Streptomyces sp. NPDC091292]|uniref:chitinase n=1 Tax=Streptomyces sp. NPDC091292 TaxID=3365991 RepID=UPI00381CB7B3
MRTLLKSAAGLVCAGALTLTGCSSPWPPGPVGARTANPTRTPGIGASARPTGPPYTPYVSATTAADTDTAGSPAAYNLAFVVADRASCTPQWGGSAAVDDPAVSARIRELTAPGRAVRVSFGGADGTELALACESPSALADAYARALDNADATEADFAVKGANLSDPVSVTRRLEAIAQLQERRDLKVSFSLPALPTGLEPDGVALLESADDHGVDIAAVNVLAMNYGTSYTGDMGDYAITAATAAQAQIGSVFGLSDPDAWQRLAVTVMLGVNDVQGETFTLTDATRFRAFAKQKNLAWLSSWSTFRDHQCTNGAATRSSTTCSGVLQERGAFARALSG